MYNWGVIGPGSIAETFADALAMSNSGKLYAVASRSHSKAQAFALRYGANHAFSDYQSLLGDPNVDVIYIATPHSHHFSWAKACLQAGKHVLLEKPLTVNAAQTAQLVELSQRHQCVFQEAMWSRFMPCFAQVKRWLDEGCIGDLQYITSQIGFAFLDRQNHRLLNPSLAGGAILDLGVYSVSLSQFLLSENPTDVQASGIINAHGVDQNTSVNMRYPSGVISQFTCTIAAQCSNSLSIHGTKGSIELPALFWNGQGAKLISDNQVVEQLRFPHQANGFEYQIAATMDAMDSGRLCDPRMNHADSVQVMKTLDQIRQQIGLRYSKEIEST